MDLWIEPSQENVLLANRALVEFGSPYLLDASKPEDILQLGLPPDRIDFFLSIDGPAFETAGPRLTGLPSTASFRSRAESTNRVMKKMCAFSPK